MLTLIRYCKFLIFFNVILSNISFNTEIGECHLNYESSDNNIIKHIQKTANELIKEFGLVKKQDFSINIINSSTKRPKILKKLSWAVGVAQKNKVIIDAEKINNYKELLQTITHEICHIYQYRINNYPTFPSWFKEGMAMHFSKENSLNRKNLVSQSIWLNCLIELKELKKISILDKSKVSLGYAESLIAYETIINQFGIKSVKSIINRMNNLNDSFSQAFEKINNLSLTDFEVFFDNKIKKSNYKWGILKNPMNWFFLSSILVIIVFIFVKFRNKKVIERMILEEELEQLNEKFIKNNNN